MKTQEALKHCTKLASHLLSMDSESQDAKAIIALLDTFPAGEVISPYRLTVTKHFDFEVYPHDLPETVTYVNAVKTVDKLGDGWRIPTLEELKLMYQHRDEIGGLCAEDKGGSDFPVWYWSSTENRVNSSCVHVVRFSDGCELWHRKDLNRFSCRPVRLVACEASRLTSTPTPAPR